MVGTTISHYKVIEKIGQGGMGEVYRAEDTNLTRDVAIKVLPEQFTKDPQRLARFEREAKLLASLNHPNIAAIYGFEEADDVRFLAMELVPGETLAERVAKGPVAVEETLEICRQIAEGVEAAHEKGVIHRDLKPANVKVTPEGKVKILDFGLAKAFEAETPVTDISQSPTLTEEMTRAGVIMGTAAYMSPEQAKGNVVDKRADIFAFGAILYELLTGRRAFEGESITETLASILKGEPNWETLPQNTPTRIRELMADCLEKGLDDRLPDIGSARIQIKKALTEPSTASSIDPTGAAQPVQQRWGITMGLVVLALAVGGLVSWLLIQPSSPEQSLNKFVITPSPPVILTNTTGTEVGISPDGRHLIYMGVGQAGRQLYLRSLDDFVDRPIPGTTNAVGMAFFSPDGESIGFFGEGKLKRISLAGGSPIVLCDAAVAGRSGDWFENTIVFSAVSVAGSAGSGPDLYRISADGGEPEMLAAVNIDEGEAGYRFPEFLPDGKHILFTVTLQGGGDHSASLSLETREQKVVLENAKQARYLPTGHLVYEQPGTGNLLAVTFDAAGVGVSGAPVPVLQGVRGSSTGGYVDYTVSGNGTLIYVPGSPGESAEYGLVWVDREGRETTVTEERREYSAPRFSPDGTKLLYSAYPGGRTLWMYDFGLDSFSRWTFQGTPSGSSVWSPDGKWIIFQVSDPGRRYLARQPADRSTPPEPLTQAETRARMPTSWSPDGQFLLFNQAAGSGGGWDILALDLAQNGEPHPVVSTTANECCAVFSPDGGWIAYVSDESNFDQVYIRPYPGPDVKFLISGAEVGGEPVWSLDGRELFYRSGRNMMAVSVETEPTVRTGRPQLLFNGDYRGGSSTPAGYQYYDISPDGKRFLMLKELTPGQTQINVIQNWSEELKRLVPTN